MLLILLLLALLLEPCIVVLQRCLVLLVEKKNKAQGVCVVISSVFRGLFSGMLAALAAM